MANKEAKLIRLGKYDGLDIPRPDSTVTFEEFHNAVEERKRRIGKKVKVEGRPARMGDVTVIDFVGLLNGEPFQGGSAQDYPLELGTDEFVKGFEEQLVGKNVGDHVDVEVTFPEYYAAPHLAGKDVTFKCDIKEIQEYQAEEMTDEEHDQLMKVLSDRKEFETEDDYDQILADAVIADSEFVVPQEVIDDEAREMVGEWGKLMMRQGMDPQMYFSMTGLTEEKMMENFIDKAEVRVKRKLVLEAIAAEQNIMATIAEINEYMEQLAKAANMELEVLRSHMTGEMLRETEKEIRNRKALNYIKLHVSLTKESDLLPKITPLD